MSSVRRVHVPAHNPLHNHFAFLSDEIDLTKVGTITYDERVMGCEFQRIISAGLYGFINKERRDHFVVTINQLGVYECAFVAKFSA